MVRDFPVWVICMLIGASSCSLLSCAPVAERPSPEPAEPGIDVTRATLAVSPSGTIACQIVNGAATCWGGDVQESVYDRLDASGDSISVTVGDDNICVLSETGTATCQRGTVGQTVPYVEVELFDSFLCGRSAMGALECIRLEAAFDGVPIPDGVYRAFSSAGSGLCALHDGGGLWCWVDSPMPGEFTTIIADGIEDLSETPIIDLSVHFDGSQFSLCGLTPSAAVQCSRATIDQRIAPPWSEDGFLQVDVGRGLGCGLRTDGSFVCVGDTTDVVGEDQGPYSEITVSDAICALGIDGLARCWGRNALLRNPAYDGPGDNCFRTHNPDQIDTDGDGDGDACDDDIDNDGMVNDEDNCVFVSNVDQLDCNFDGVGDRCSDDQGFDNDGDGVDDYCDNCPSVSNADQQNSDACATGTICGADRCDIILDGSSVSEDDSCSDVCERSGGRGVVSLEAQSVRVCAARSNVVSSPMRPFADFDVPIIVQCVCDGLIDDGVGDACTDP